MPWLAPLALGGLFAAWMTVTPRAAAALGLLAGTVFFSLNFSWFGETAGALLGPFGGLLDLGPALIEAFAFALAAAITALAARRLAGAWIPLVTAAAFSLTELLRSSGLLGVPLYQVGAAFVETPLAPIAAYGGVYALTFVVAWFGAALAVAALERDRRFALRQAGVALAFIAASAGLAYAAWPARSPAAATVRVAAVQGNIRQSVKWNPASLPLAVERYTNLTLTLRSFKPQFVLWPETVISTDLLLDPAVAANPANAGLVAEDARLMRQFRSLSRTLDTVLVVGSVEAGATQPYNVLVFFEAGAGPQNVYRKRQLVPFAEFLPGPAWLRSLPFAALVSSFGAGAEGAPIGASLRVAPLICWEAGFTDLAQRQAAAGASFFAVATDDAWFGDSDGPFAQAQLSQLRAIETGRWVVRAAATGISGIVAPDGRWRARSSLDTQDVVRGMVGAPQPTLYSRIGPWPVGGILTLLLVAGFGVGRRVR